MEHETYALWPAKLDPIAVRQPGLFHAAAVQICSLFAADIAEQIFPILNQHLCMRPRDADMTQYQVIARTAADREPWRQDARPTFLSRFVKIEESGGNRRCRLDAAHRRSTHSPPQADV